MAKPHDRTETLGIWAPHGVTGLFEYTIYEATRVDNLFIYRYDDQRHYGFVHLLHPLEGACYREKRTDLVRPVPHYPPYHHRSTEDELLTRARAVRHEQWRTIEGARILFYPKVTHQTWGRPAIIDIRILRTAPLYDRYLVIGNQLKRPRRVKSTQSIAPETAYAFSEFLRDREIEIVDQLVNAGDEFARILWGEQELLWGDDGPRSVWALLAKLAALEGPASWRHP